MGTTARDPQQAAFGDDVASNPHIPKTLRRPRQRPPLSSLEIALLLVTFVGLAFDFLPLAFDWSSLPATVPTRFDAAGHPNGYGSKYTLLIAPLIALAITLIFLLLARFPWAFNYPVTITPQNALRQYQRGRRLLRWVNGFLVWLFALIEWMTVQSALGDSAPTTWITPALIGVTLLIPIAALTLIVVWTTRGK